MKKNIMKRRFCVDPNYSGVFMVVDYDPEQNPCVTRVLFHNGNRCFGKLGMIPSTTIVYNSKQLIEKYPHLKKHELYLKWLEVQETKVYVPSSVLKTLNVWEIERFETGSWYNLVCHHLSHFRRSQYGIKPTKGDYGYKKRDGNRSYDDAWKLAVKGPNIQDLQCFLKNLDQFGCIQSLFNEFREVIR